MLSVFFIAGRHRLKKTVALKATDVCSYTCNPIYAVLMWCLTLTLLTWTIWRDPTNASKWRMGFNSYPANVDNMARSYHC